MRFILPLIAISVSFASLASANVMPKCEAAAGQALHEQFSATVYEIQAMQCSPHLSDTDVETTICRMTAIMKDGSKAEFVVTEDIKCENILSVAAK